MTLPNGVTGRIILVRHGAPIAAAKGVVYGKLDVGLSEDGKAQIAETVRWLKKIDLSAIYASPRIRAAESAKLAAAQFGLHVAVENRFAEIDFGDFEGASYDDVKNRFPEIYDLWMTRPTEVEFPNGESFSAMRRRVLKAIKELTMRHTNQTAAVFSHGGVNRIVLAEALSLPTENLFRLDQNYGCANVIDFYGDYPLVRLVNHNFGEF